MDSFVEWAEEVRLLDGRVITVQQKKRVGDGVAREAWLTITIPELGEPIVWHENLMPLVVNIDQGKLYVVGFPPTEKEYRQYGAPRPPYIGFLWKNGKWERLSFNAIPKQIYEANMLAENFPPSGTTVITVDNKHGRRLSGSPELPGFLKKIDPNVGAFQ